MLLFGHVVEIQKIDCIARVRGWRRSSKHCARAVDAGTGGGRRRRRRREERAAVSGAGNLATCAPARRWNFYYNNNIVLPARGHAGSIHLIPGTARNVGKNTNCVRRDLFVKQTRLYSGLSK